MTYNPSQVSAVVPTPKRILVKSLNIVKEGADPTGMTEMADKISAIIKSLGTGGGEIIVPKGVYLIDPVKSVKLISNLRLIFEEGAIFRAKPNNAIRYEIITALGLTNVVIEGGQLLGDRDAHTYTVQSTPGLSTHEWGMGLRIAACIGVSVLGMSVQDTTGDGFIVAAKNIDSDSAMEPCQDVFIQDCSSKNNRRQGISIITADNVTIQRCEIANINGTNPQGGVDVEPDLNGTATNVTVEDCYIHGCKGSGILTYKAAASTGHIRDMMFRRNKIEGNATGFYLTGAENTSILGNRITRSNSNGTVIQARTTPVAFHENTSGYNYASKGAVERTDFQFTGYKSTLERDLLIRNTGIVNDIGNNYYI